MQLFTSESLKINIIIYLILAVGERILQEDFVCSCDEKYRTLIAFLHFVVPACLSCGSNYIFLELEGLGPTTLIKMNASMLSALLWIVLLLSDGRYYACAMFPSDPPCNGTVDVKDLQSTDAFFRSKITVNLKMVQKDFGFLNVAADFDDCSLSCDYYTEQMLSPAGG
ncbi:hypothetical protein DNTS_024579 [Danionella cerebrum]|uniref:Uncharacterized protein n=1 Tax=Danionella cerebrum TaxID=2873325 RepID=A0A553NHK3_9TELE|nr:hypothetical protein DNTS_024579 [Danionella translucida]